MNYVSIGDLNLWSQCRRRWFARCLPQSGSRTPAIPDGMTGESSVREAARVAADGPTREHAELRDLWSPYNKAHTPTLESYVLVTDPQRISERSAATLRALEARTGFRNGVLEYDGLVVSIDVARYRPRLDAWDVFLYRAATGIRGAFYGEGAAITYVFDRRGIPIHAVHIVYLDKSFRSNGESGRPYRESNITGRARLGQQNIVRDVGRLQNALAGTYKVPVDYVCRQACELCSPTKNEPDQHDIRTLHRGAGLARELLSAGIRTMDDLRSAEVKLSARQQIQVESVGSDSRYADPAALAAFLESVVFPRFFLDFEAYAPAIPPFRNLAPYEHIPVVASLHVQRDAESPLEHGEFAAAPGLDNRVEMFAWLEEQLGNHGSIVVFGKGFESAMISQLAGVSGLIEAGERLIARLVDLLDPFNQFLVYDPRQLGKVSLKRVLPIYTDTGYESMTVRDGMHANLSYARLADSGSPSSIGSLAAGLADETLRRFDMLTPVATIAEISAYCAVDTVAMARLLAVLSQIVRSPARWTPVTDLN